MDVVLSQVREGGPAHRAGLRRGDAIEAMGGAPVLDFIDWQFFGGQAEFDIAWRDGRGLRHTAWIEKDPSEPLGMETEADLYPPERRCANRCLFCFVDQLPPGLRDSLYVKDDDWRYSMLFGNYISMTNVTEADLARIVARQVSPLYVSVHAMDPQVRECLMGNPRAGHLPEQLRRLKAGGIVFHSQVVLCPGYNDGPVLEKTLSDLWNLYPAARSVAVVPVGLTAHRAHLPPLRPVSRAGAREAVEMIEGFAARCRQESGEAFAYAADELYAQAGLPWPRYPDGAHTPQMSNGVGLMDDFLSGFELAIKALGCRAIAPRRVVVATGCSAAGTLRELAAALCGQIQGLSVEVAAVENRLFGPAITVAGLMTAQDIAGVLADCMPADEVLIPACCTREDGLLLDDRSAAWLSHTLGVPIAVAPEDGYELALRLAGQAEGELT